MRALLAALLSLSMLPAAMAQAQRGIVLQAQPTSPLLPVPPTPPRLKPAPGGYEPAPTPNRDVDAPLGPRASNAPQVSPGLFTRKDLYRGDGYARGSTSETEVEKRVKPTPGFNLRLPLQPQ